ncbi:hypothetical protein EDD18DRAFT_1102571 [Armillaria luteobubalina]|uniref:Arylesterase n=1 Tax=Armillaria luteobubalina TaxID=153913 RepID=A0AA39QCM7_9AGAR|nr:hypothetical protein EDD18DRAFT_1102571 [Armillaria luteobubalina]
MSFRSKLAIFVVLTSFYVWRSQYTLRNSILTVAPFPDGYIRGGNFSSQCETLKDESGNDALKFCEDVTFWDLHDGEAKLEERKVLFTCDSGRKQWNTVMGPLHKPEPHGSLWLYSPNSETVATEKSSTLFGFGKAASVPTKPQRVALENYPEGHDFHPLGAKIWPSYAGNSSNLFIVNHAGPQTYIEQFVISPSSPTVATYIRTIAAPYLVSPNALALTSPNSFYVSNDHLITRRWPVIGHVVPLMETLLGLPLGWVAHVTLDSDASSPVPIETHAVAAPFIPFPNGVAISASGTQVAIASTSLSQIMMYSRNASTNELVFQESILVPFCPDNIDFDDNDSLIVGGHPHFPTLVKVVKSAVPHAPSWVLSIAPRESKLTEPPVNYDVMAPISAGSKVPAALNWDAVTLLQSNGVGFSSSTTGARDSRTGALYVSGLYAEEGLLVCRPTLV